jgi:hypothetical protein
VCFLEISSVLFVFLEIALAVNRDRDRVVELEETTRATSSKREVLARDRTRPMLYSVGTGGGILGLRPSSC